MKQLGILSAAAALAVGVMGCESRTYDNDIERTDRTTSARIDSSGITNDRMNSGNPNDRVGRTPAGSATSGGTINSDNSGIDRAGTGTGTDIGTGGTGTGTGTGTGAGSSGAGTGR
jgi:hypothetical protein